MAKHVAVIPAKPLQEIKGLPVQAKTRVCAYCRVSTDNEEQLSSYEAQVNHYTGYINSKPEWEFAGIYADEGISGTNTKKRAEFNRMIEDCLAGKIDLVLTKSVSRFARNTLDCLKYIRMLREKGIAVYFEKENINTLDAKGEFLLVIMGSLAQQESFSLSSNTRWGIVHQFQQGQVRVNHNKFLGYTKNDDGELVIVPEEAEVVRRIYAEYLEGKSVIKIAKGLERDGVLTGAGNSKWCDATIRKILTNEKYMGDALLQKTITVDFLTKKREINKGHVQQYYVEDSHPAIVSKDTFHKVQEEMKRRSRIVGCSKSGKSRYTNKYPFSGKIFCGSCGDTYRRHRWGSGKYLKRVWLCSNKDKNGRHACDMKGIDEDRLEEAFLRVVNQAIVNKTIFVDAMLKNIEKVIPEDEQETKMEIIESRLKSLQQELMKLIRHNASTGPNSQDYDDEYSKIADEIGQLRRQQQTIEEQQFEEMQRKKRTEEIIQFLEGRGQMVDTFDEELFRSLIEKINVLSIVEIEFVFHSGVKVKETL